MALIWLQGFMIGPEAERMATIRYGTAFVLAAATCIVPWYDTRTITNVYDNQRVR
jgi:acetyl-CoA carboxylase carboxyltransferase component